MRGCDVTIWAYKEQGALIWIVLVGVCLGEVENNIADYDSGTLGDCD